jgi:ribosomal-protein-alanine N-acetyltransferase
MIITRKCINEYVVVLRSAVISDASALADLDQICFSVPWSRSAFESDLSDPANKVYLVWEAHYSAAEPAAGIAPADVNIILMKNRNSRIIGYGGFWQIVDDAEIMNIAIHPEWRRLHLAGELLTAMVESAKARKLNTMSLEVRTGNQAAFNLYRRFGFEQSGIRPGYYSDNGEDAIIMLKNI